MTLPSGDAPTIVPQKSGGDETIAAGSPPPAKAAPGLEATLPAHSPLADIQATLPMGSAPVDPQATLPMAATRAAGSTTVDPNATRATAIGDPSALAATAIASGTNSGGTTTGGATTGSTSGTRSGTMGATQMGGTLSRTGTRLGRTRVNGGLQQTEQQLDEKLQMSRGSVLADMTMHLGQTSGGGTPKGLQKLIDEQGTEGRYHINRPLAAGGMGAVLDIADNDFRRQAAMKVMHGQFSKDPASLERFLAEAQVTAQLEHPNIVPIHDMGVMADGTLYFTMKLIEGVSLGDVVKFRQMHRGLITEEDYVSDKLRKESKKKPGERKAEPKIRADYAEEKAKGAELDARFTLEETLLAFLKVLDGVGFAHSRGVIHRDIKPDNIMLGGHGEVLVVDWGIAKVLGSADKESELVKNIEKHVVSIRDADSMSATMDGSTMGTIFYMPPEQASGDLSQIDGRSDIYALGATLYELLSLKRCLKASSIPEMIASITTGDWVPFNVALPTADPDLVAIIHRAMALTPANRYATCDAFAEDLRRFLAGQAVAARKRGIGELLAKWIAQNKTKLITGAAGVVLVVGAAVGTVEYLKAQTRARAEALVQEAKAAFEKALTAKDLDGLNQAQNKVGAAETLDKANPAITPLTVTISNAIEAVKAELKAEAAKSQNLATAKALVAEAQALEAANKLDEADAKLITALELDPTNKDYRAIRDQLTKRLNDVLLQKQTEQAKKVRAEGDALFAQAKGLALTDPSLAGILSQAEAKFALAEKDVAVPGTQEQVKAVALLRDQAAKAAKTAADQAKAKDLLAQAKAAYAAGAPAGKFDEAKTLAAQARGFDPANDEAVQLIARVNQEADQFIAKEQEAKARSERLKTATATSDGHLAEATASYAKMQAAYAASQKSQAEAEDLGRRLAKEPLERKAPLWAALAAAESARKDVALLWATTESAAQNALAFLKEFPEEKERTAKARRLLADLYHGRLVDARTSRSLPEVAAYTNLLRRFDDGHYAAELANRGQITVTGGSGLTARRIDEGPDTRLVPLGAPLPLTPGQLVDLDAGTYQISGGGVAITVVVSTQKPVNLTWPSNLPTIPGHSLKYVPSDGVRPAFLLGETEVTQGQYLEFLNDPEQLRVIAAGWQTVYNKIINRESKDVSLTYIPKSDDLRGYKFHKLITKDAELKSIQLDGRIENRPIASISQDSAKAFCRWLSAKTKLNVRLPLAAERHWAATGGDDRRIYPWGRWFSGQFATSALNGQPATAPAVGSTPSDLGPFGHVDLGGSVREWLNDQKSPDNPFAAGVHGSLIAGGSWGDDSQLWFRSDYTESAEHEFESEQIGFRILVELP